VPGGVLPERAHRADRQAGGTINGAWPGLRLTELIWARRMVGSAASALRGTALLSRVPRDASRRGLARSKPPGAASELSASWNGRLIAEALEDLGVQIMDLVGDPFECCAGGLMCCEVTPLQRVVREGPVACVGKL
jgi:hypothetical protein